AEECPDIVDEPLGFFHRSEMTARRHYSPAFQIVASLSPPARHQHHLLQEDGDAGRRLDYGLALMRGSPKIMRGFVNSSAPRYRTFALPSRASPWCTVRLC